MADITQHYITLVPTYVITLGVAGIQFLCDDGTNKDYKQTKTHKSRFLDSIHLHAPKQINNNACVTALYRHYFV